MGIFRKNSSSKLKERLLKEAKLDSYSKKFDTLISKLQVSYIHYVDMAKEGKENNNEHMIKTGIKYANYVQGNLNKMLNLKTNLEATKMSLESQSAYNLFVDAISDFTNELGENGMKKRKARKAMNKQIKKTKSMSKQFNMIDKKIVKIDKNMDTILSNDKELSSVDVDAFFENIKS